LKIKEKKIIELRILNSANNDRIKILRKNLEEITAKYKEYEELLSK
jgi:hypothetical protein